MIYLIEWISGALPVLGVAWIIRRAMRRSATGLNAAVTSVLIAGVVGYLIRSFADGEGGFGPRVANVASGSELSAIAGATAVALALILLWRRGRLSA